MATKSAGSLAEYNRRRDFARTKEPAGKHGRASGRSFVVQKHDATRLHYDFRLELDGVLLSWAVTKGPSLDPGQKRLAVHTEDHPLDYGGFEGTIPKGEYGGGTVMLWDRGSWEPLHDPREGMREGKLHFRLDGERMKGGWALVRMPPRAREKRENWLLIKERDDTADEADPLLATYTTSVATGRSMEEIATGDSAVWHSDRTDGKEAEAPAKSRPRSRKKSAAARPAFRPVQLATLVSEAPEGGDWLHELKYDGYRCLAACAGSDVRCYTRNEQDWTEKFRRIAEALSSLDLPGVLIDGEIVAFAPDGRTDFSTLQKALKEGGPLAFFAFDLLEAEGEDLTKLPLVERKQRLAALLDDLPEDGPIRLSVHVTGEGPAVFSNICAAGHEGIVSKKADAPYRGARSRSWLKVKCTRRQEFVIGGWAVSDKRRGFRSLLVGAHEDGALVYKGRVGTGFDDDDLETLSARFETLARKTSPFAALPREAKKGARFVEPKLVAEIAFTEFTSDGILRHPSYLGLREDKAAKEVQMEKPAPVTDAAAKPSKGEGGDALHSGIRITSPDKVLFPAQGLTKGDLVAYYEAIADLMLPHLKDRPLSLVRCPQGRARKCFFQKHSLVRRPTGSPKPFFQKHDSGGFPDELKRLMIRENNGGEAQYFYVSDLAGIIAGVQMGVLEFHIWGSRRDQVEKPDRIVFDLDPDEGLDFGDVRRAALDIRDRLDAIGLTTFPMLSGGKGIHVVAPLTRRMEWPQVKAFCRAFAVHLGGEEPQHYVANMAKAKRKGRIFVDYLRNERGSTAIAPYSTRAREGATVAAPVTWDEVARLDSASVYNVSNMNARARKAGDPWPGYFDVRQSITRAMLTKVGGE